MARPLIRPPATFSPRGGEKDLRCAALLILLASACAHHDLTPREVNAYLSGGGSRMNFHGHSQFRSVHFEVAGQSAAARKWLRTPEAGASIAYSDVHQARSWFGYRYGDPNDSVRAVSSYVFVRHRWRDWSDFQPYAEIGTGPMWSNRRIPAATSRFNMNSQAGFGAVLFSNSRMPLRIGYRFSHISNGGLMGRNPGLEVHQVIVGFRVHRLGLMSVTQ